MNRPGGLIVLFVAVLPAWLNPSLCRGQSPVGSLPRPIPFRPSTSAAVSPSLPAPRRRLVATAAAGVDSGPSSRRGSVDTAVARAARGFQAPLPGSTARPIPPPRPADQMAVRLNAAPLEPTDLRFPINLATALRLSDARPLIVAAAQASVWVAEAQLTRAKVLWVPSFALGFDYLRHDGGSPDINKGVMTAASMNLFYGGAGLYQMVNLTDAYFEPLAARQVLNSRQWDIQTAKNDALLMTADAYFGVHQYRGMYAGALYCVRRGHDLVERLSGLSRDLVPPDEIERARTLLAEFEQQATSAREAWRTHSADLTQILRLDPRAVVVPMEHDHLQITLVDPAMELRDLIHAAVTHRPELASYQALVKAAEARVSREKMRPVLPLVMLNGFQTPGTYYNLGMFGLGPNSSLNQWVGRDDVSIQFVWQFDALGIGNVARIKQQRAAESAAIIKFYKAQDTVSAEVTAAQARVQSAAARVKQADRGLRASIITFDENFAGLKQTSRFENVLIKIYRPQQVTYALYLLKPAFDEYFATVAEYNRAEFDLYHALGFPAREIVNSRPPGEVLPVDTARPGYLPPVGNGPPPATH